MTLKTPNTIAKSKKPHDQGGQSVRSLQLVCTISLLVLAGCSSTWTVHADREANVYARAVNPFDDPRNAKTVHLGVVKPNAPVQVRSGWLSDPVIQLVTTDGQHVEYLFGRSGKELRAPSGQDWLPLASYDTDARQGIVKPGAFMGAVLFAWGFPRDGDADRIEFRSGQVDTFFYPDYPNDRFVSLTDGFVTAISR